MITLTPGSPPAKIEYYGEGRKILTQANYPTLMEIIFYRCYDGTPFDPGHRIVAVWRVKSLHPDWNNIDYPNNINV